ncbi:MAG: T9SS type A sorting domain-containing protein [Ignavibacteria bacterium]|nr:T9SS type A sorting domain-containing protein [Ignavibacteria bacterium]
MKKIILVLLIVHCTLLIAEAQWIQQNSGTNQNLRDVEFINDKTGWAVGDGGVVLKTTNSGTNWLNIPNPAVGKPLFSIHLVDSNNIYFVGWFETIIKSTDGGSSWITIQNGPFGQGRSFTSLFFVNKDTGWIGGGVANYYILKTTNGGITFDSSYLFWGELNDMFFKNTTTGLVCASGAVFKTTNAGINWFNTKVPTNGVFYPFKKLAIINNNVWVAAGDTPPIYKSVDFGNSWKILDSIHNYPPSVANCISFSDENTGWVGGSYGYLYKTTNGGYNWQREETAGDQRYWGSIYCYNDSIAWGVGGAGKIRYTTNGGQTMVSINTEESNSMPDFKLYQNFPNPFNPETTIEFYTQESNMVSLKVFDSMGKLVKVILDNKLIIKGNHTYNFIAKELPSGIYYYQIHSKNINITKKMVLVK